nr:hypothetical protein [Tanacetum cinerariifolium]
MPFGMPGGGFLNDLEEDLDCYDGYEAQIYDLTEQEKAICDRYDIFLNSHCLRKPAFVCIAVDMSRET